MTDAVRRTVFIAAALAIVVGLAVAGGSGRAEVTRNAGHGLSAAGVTVSASHAESSAWFCVGGTGPTGVALATVVLTNATARTVTGTLTAVPVGAAAHSTAVSVAAHSQIGVVPTQVATGDEVAATVVMDGGGVGVSQVVSGPLGYSVSPCASTTSDQWFFADGSTASGPLLLALFNPARTTAVVDIAFVSSSGVVQPPAYQGIDVPGNSLVVENVGDHLRNVTDLATTVSALSGEVVAAQTQSYGSPGAGGPSVVLGALRPAPRWSFAQNTDVTGGATVFHIFNPSSRPVRLQVRFALQQGQAEPLVVRVAGQSVAIFDTAKVTRLPADIPYAVTFSARRGAGVIVARGIAAPAGTSPPQLGEVSGSPGEAERFLLPAVTSPATQVSLAVVDLHATAATVTVSMFSQGRTVPVPGFAHRVVRPGTPLIVTPAVGSAIGAQPVLLTADAPVAVEIDALPVGSSGIVVIPALPLG
jgi:hypothetical protein